MKPIVVALCLFCAYVAVEGRNGYFDYPQLLPRGLKLEGPIAPKPQAIQKANEKTRKFNLEVTPTIVNANKDHMEKSHLREGDIKEQKQMRNTIVNCSLFWDTKQIPVLYSSDISLLAKATIDEARREYELRTCLSFPQREDEKNYLYFQPLSGCWSYVGMTGGEQNISIGRGCEQMATVQHEMMHAIGVWHEQSRADRDDYVDIIWSAITVGQLHNFFKYDFNDTDDRRVSYDFNSVMHYDKTAFSANGATTIQTRDPAFEDVIGQRSTFSHGDVTKIQRMYNCSDTVRVSYTVNFEEESVGGYSSYDTDSDVAWIRHDVATSDTSGATTKYLPKFDSTLGTHGYGSYMYLDTSVKYPNLAGTIKSMRYITTVAQQCLEFSYFMDTVNGSQATFTVYVANIDPTTGVITSYGLPLQTFSGKYGANWNVQRMTISAPASYRIVFSAKTGGYSSDIIAIDDVSVVDKECDTSYFQVPHYSQILATYQQDQAFVSPTMYTGTPGYAFQILVYPTGTSTTAGYTSMYFRLVGGIYDDELEWPFDKQFVRFVITDQGPDALTRMNYYYNFLTDADSLVLGSAWQKPAGLGEPNGAVGYSAFMNNDKWSTRMYLKHDTAYYSVQVTDMRPYADGNTDMSAQYANPILRRAEDVNKVHQPKFHYKQVYSIDHHPEGEHLHGEDGDHEHHPEGEHQHGEDGDHEHHPEEEHHHHDHHEEEHHPHPTPAPEEEEDGMIPVATAALITLVTCAGVFLAMSVLICCVARSYKNRPHGTAVVNNIRHTFPGDTMKYSNLKNKV